MKVFMGFLLFCFFCGWLTHKVRLSLLTMMVIMLSIMVSGGYFFLRLI